MSKNNLPEKVFIDPTSRTAYDNDSVYANRVEYVRTDIAILFAQKMRESASLPIYEKGYKKMLREFINEFKQQKP